jgi:hypothetical protein
MSEATHIYVTRKYSTTNTRKNDMHCSNTCDMYMCRLRHINDSVLSSLKMEGIRLLHYFLFENVGETRDMLFLISNFCRVLYVV